MRLLILCCFLCGACRFALPGTGSMKLLPDTIAPARSSDDRQLPGTQLFVRLPEGYIIDSTRDTIRGLKGSVIGYKYLPGSAIGEVMPGFEHGIDSAMHKTYLSKQAFNMGSYSALLYYFVAKKAHSEALSLIFGDAQFTAVCVGVIPDNDTANRSEVLNTMVSLYRDEDVTAGEVTPFTLDLGQSGFAWLNREGNTYVYTFGGASQSSLEDPVDGFLILNPQQGALTPRDVLEKFLDKMADNSQINLSPRKLVALAGGKWETTGRFVMSGQKGIYYGFCTGTSAQPLVLTAFLYGEPGSRLAEVKRIAGSLALKP